MSRQDRVVGLDNRRRDLGRRIHGKLQFGLFRVVDGETLEQEGTETRARATAKGVEDKDTLETIT
jgi:hypothetical protein